MSECNCDSGKSHDHMVGCNLNPPMTPSVEPVATDIERDIRIALWNTGCWQGKPQEVAQSFIRHAMEEPSMKRALAKIAELEGALKATPLRDRYEDPEDFDDRQTAWLRDYYTPALGPRE